MPRTTRTEELELRLSPSARIALQSAAAAAQRSVSEFVLESALLRAGEVLPDRGQFGLDAERWAAFHAAPDAPTHRNPRLRELLRTPSVFERGCR